jgi:hypothetical protein
MSHRLKAPQPEAIIAVCAALIVLLIAVLIVAFTHKSTSTEKTAQHATTTARRATHAVAGKASKRDLKKTDHTAKVAHASAVRVEHRLTVVRQDFTRVVNVNGLRGLAGRPGINGKDAVFPFTLQDLLARIPPPVAGPQGDPGPGPSQEEVQDAVALKLAQALVTSCGGPCNGRDGTNGVDGSDGAPGPAGPAGADSTVPGPQGPPGVQGDPGPAGPQGPAGTSPTQFVCQPPGADGTQACAAVG